MVTQLVGELACELFLLLAPMVSPRPLSFPNVRKRIIIYRFVRLREGRPQPFRRFPFSVDQLRTERGKKMQPEMGLLARQLQHSCELSEREHPRA